jgi:hypothetical protein
MSKTKGSFAKKSSKKQKIYKIKGCSKTRKNYLGGSTDTPLAYTGEKTFFSVPNPNLAYTGKGGSSCGLSKSDNIPVNTNSANPAYPNTGPVSNGADTIFNNSSSQLGGGKYRKKGGSCPSCTTPFMSGGSNHRKECKCSTCKRNISMKGGNQGIPYPNGLVGSPWTPNESGWPGVNGIPGDSNYYPVNQYNNGDPQTAMVDVGANRPFLYMKGGKKQMQMQKQKQRGGTLSNFLGQDLINLGRQFQFGIGSAYNALAGYPAPVNPLPWKDQFPSRASFNPAII